LKNNPLKFVPLQDESAIEFGEHVRALLDKRDPAVWKNAILLTPEIGRAIHSCPCVETAIGILEVMKLMLIQQWQEKQ